MTHFCQVTKLLSNAMHIFVSERASGWKNTLCLAILSLALGLATGICLFLIFHLSLVFNYMESVAVACLLGIALSVLLFFFKLVRCMSILFLLSCGMREGRNALIAAGSGIIMFCNVKNIFTNLKILADSIMCNLEAKRFSLWAMPFQLYRQAMYWIYNQTKHFINPFTDIILVSDTFEGKILIEDEILQSKLNVTKQQIQRMAENISSVLEIGSYVGHLLLLLIGASMVLVGTGLFLRRYLNIDSNAYENFYITYRFVELDNSKKQKNADSVFPLKNLEEKLYIRIPSLKITSREKKKMVLHFIPVFANIFIWCLLTLVDFVLYWLIFTLSKHLEELPPISVPMKVIVSEKTYVESLQINLFEPQCIPKAELSLSGAWIPLSIIILVLFVLGLFSAFLIQIKLLVTASFYPSKDLQRVQYLHNKILRKRSKAAARNGGKKLSIKAFGVNFWFPILRMMHSTKSKLDSACYA